MHATRTVLLCLAVAGAMVPMTAYAASEDTGTASTNAAPILESTAPEAEVVANQMRDYYLNETGPEGTVFYTFGTSSMTLPEADATGDYRLLELPLYRQSHNFTCGVACVASVLRYAGYDFDTREDRLLWELAATPENGTNYMRIAEYLDSVRMEDAPDTPVFATEIIRTDYVLDESDPTLSDRLLSQFRAALDNGSPVICAIQAWRDDGDYTAQTEDDGHYVVLIGYEKDTVSDTYMYFFMDPSTAGSYTYLTEQEFILRWHDSVEGKPTRIAIAVSYADPERDAPIHTAYHLD